MAKKILHTVGGLLPSAVGGLVGGGLFGSKKKPDAPVASQPTKLDDNQTVIQPDGTMIPRRRSLGQSQGGSTILSDTLG